MIYIKNNSNDSDNNMYLTVGSMIDINTIVSGSNNITLRTFNVKPHGCDKMYMDEDLIEDQLYKLIDQFNKRKINQIDFTLHHSTIYISIIRNGGIIIFWAQKHGLKKFLEIYVLRLFNK